MDGAPGLSKKPGPGTAMASLGSTPSNHTSYDIGSKPESLLEIVVARFSGEVGCQVISTKRSIMRDSKPNQIRSLRCDRFYLFFARGLSDLSHAKY